MYVFTNMCVNKKASSQEFMLLMLFVYKHFIEGECICLKFIALSR